MQSRFPSKKLMETPGIPSTRWFDATLLPKDQVDQPDNAQAMFVMGHGSNTITRMPESGARSRSSSCWWSAIPIRRHGRCSPSARTARICCRPAPASKWRLAHRLEPLDAMGRTNREPVFESKNDYDTMYLFARKFGFADQMFKNIKVENNAVSAGRHPARNQSRRLVHRLLRPVARAAQGAHGEPGQVRSGHHAAPKDDPEVGGDYYGLPWPCWGTPEFKHPGTPILYNTNLRSRTAAARSAPASASSVSSSAR
jgi:formate dehydrogenase major subunit